MAYEDYIRLIPKGYKVWTKYLKDFDKMRDGNKMVQREVSDSLFSSLISELYGIVAPYIRFEEEVVNKTREVKKKKKAKPKGKDKGGKVKVTYKKRLNQIKT